MPKVIITGGTGFIGSHTIIELIERTDFEIVSIDNYSNSSVDSLDRIEEITGKRIVNHEVNICDNKAFESILASEGKIDGIIHFAALKSVPDSVANPLSYFDNNLGSLTNVLKACEKFNIPHHIFSSSCSVYGNVESPVNELTPLNKTLSPYAHTKKVGEEIIEAFSLNSAVNTIALRYFNPVGAHISGKNGENPINPPNNLVPVITQTAVGIIPSMTVFGEDYDTRDGTCIRDYVHVTDIARAHVLALKYLLDSKNESNYDIINLGSGTGVSVLEAIQTFEKISGIDLNYTIGPRREGDVGAIYSDVSKAKKLLNWEVEHDITSMMSSAWKWQQFLTNK